MRRTAKEKREPYVKPVKKFELSSKGTKWRLILLIVLLIGGLTLMVVSLVKSVTPQPGWATIGVDYVDPENCGADFSLQYLLGETELGVDKENRAISKLYTEAAVSAFRIFHAEKDTFTAGKETVTVNNLYYLSTHIGQKVEVDPALYRALELMEGSGTRALYLAPLYESYRSLCASPDDSYAQAVDPVNNPEVRAFYDEVIAFINQEAMIDLQLLGNNTVCLQVAQEYQDYAKSKDISVYLDFGWTKNAFVVDYLAQALMDAGYTNGIIGSYDGFTRNLDNSERGYSVNLYHRVGDKTYNAARMDYVGSLSVVSLHNYPTHEMNVHLYYAWDDGRLDHCFLDATDGHFRTAVNDYVAFSKTAGCGEIVSGILPIYVAQDLDWDKVSLQTQRQNAIHYALIQDLNVYVSSKQVSVETFFIDPDTAYQPIFGMPAVEEVPDETVS